MIFGGRIDLEGRFEYCDFACMKILTCNGFLEKICRGLEGLEGLTCFCFKKISGVFRGEIKKICSSALKYEVKELNLSFAFYCLKTRSKGDLLLGLSQRGKWSSLIIVRASSVKCYCVSEVFF